jgi:putative DNA primase/helicase
LDGGKDSLMSDLRVPEAADLISTPVDQLVVPAPSNPLAVARQFVDDRYACDLGSTVAAHRGLFHLWTGRHWSELEEHDVRSALYGWLEDAWYWKETKNGPELVPFEPNKYKIANIVEALKAAEHIPSELDTPAWRGAVTPWGADVAVPMQNGILARSTRTLHSHSPSLFNLHSLPFPYDPTAPAPERWLAFLDELWPDDEEMIRTLQEWLGYVLAGGTEQQKLFLFVGPKRSGKGTIIRVATALLGPENVAAPTLNSLAQNFGLAPLVGKPLAAISDARLGTRSDSLVAVERLLSISGEDTITVDRKYRNHWTGRLPTRFTILTNELPQFTDASGALASRFIIISFRNSFYGRENPRPTEELLAEAPAIFNWALEGLDRLTANGHFVQPAASAAAVQHLEDLASPVSAFLRDQCTLAPEATVAKDDLWAAWKIWAEDAGVKKGTRDLLIRDLRAAQPQIRSSRPRIAGKRVYVLTGLRLGADLTVEETPDRTDRSDGAKPSRSGVSGVPTTVDPTHHELDDEPPTTLTWNSRLYLGEPGYPLQADRAFADGLITERELHGLLGIDRLVRRQELRRLHAEAAVLPERSPGW